MRDNEIKNSVASIESGLKTLIASQLTLVHMLVEKGVLDHTEYLKKFCDNLMFVDNRVWLEKTLNDLNNIGK